MHYVFPYAMNKAIDKLALATTAAIIARQVTKNGQIKTTKITTTTTKTTTTNLNKLIFTHTLRSLNKMFLLHFRISYWEAKSVCFYFLNSCWQEYSTHLH
jgi:hypothetical protein